MKIVSWNLNGLLSSLKNDALTPVLSLSPDVLCLQEIRTQQELVVAEGYSHFWNHCKRDGYAGTAMLCRPQLLQVMYGFDGKIDLEGRVITAEFNDYFIVNAYVIKKYGRVKQVPSRVMRKFVCRLRLNEVSRQ